MSDQPSARVVDAFQAFLYDHTDTGPMGEEHRVGLLHEAIRELLDQEPDAFLILDFDGDVGGLIVVNREARVVRVTENEATIEFLGPLRGKYTERFSPTQLGTKTVLRFDDKRLPGGVLELTLTPVASHASISRAERARREEIEKLRPLLRAWADESARSSPPPSETTPGPHGHSI